MWKKKKKKKSKHGFMEILIILCTDSRPIMGYLSSTCFMKMSKYIKILKCSNMVKETAENQREERKKSTKGYQEKERAKEREKIIKYS